MRETAKNILAAIRDKKDDRLKELSCELFPGWLYSWPYFARELREMLERFVQSTEPLNHIDEVYRKGEFAAVKAARVEKVGGCLILYFCLTPDGWRSCSLHNAPMNARLKENLDEFVKSVEKMVMKRATEEVVLAAKGKFADIET